MKLTDEQKIEYIQNVRFNPLANYALQVESKPYKRKKKVSETSLADDVRFDLMNLDEDSNIRITDDYGNFKHSQVISGAANRNLILSMTPTAQSLFIWIHFKLDYRSDTVEIKLEEVNDTGLDISGNTFGNALDELEERNIIKRIGEKRTDEYWLFHINPQIMWKGNAKRFYKDVLEAHPDYMPKDNTPRVKRPRKRKSQTQ